MGGLLGGSRKQYDYQTQRAGPAVRPERLDVSTYELDMNTNGTSTATLFTCPVSKLGSLLYFEIYLSGTGMTMVEVDIDGDRLCLFLPSTDNVLSKIFAFEYISAPRIYKDITITVTGSAVYNPGVRASAIIVTESAGEGYFLN